jgi:asparagine synthetase B (glutamine-hydrolysing)
MRNNKQYILDVHLYDTPPFIDTPAPGYKATRFTLSDMSIDLIRTETSDVEDQYLFDPDRLLGICLDGYILFDSKPYLGSPEVISRIFENSNGISEIMLGIYNLVVIDANARTVDIYNDTLGLLPCYYMQLPNRLVISNSLWLLKQQAMVETNTQGFAERFALTYIIDDKTVFNNVFRTRPGNRYQFVLDTSVQIKHQRLATTWTRSDKLPLTRLLPELSDVWNQTIDRCVRFLQPPLGLMLSGGLDSRLVLGGMYSKQVEMTACTHGNMESPEVQIARYLCVSLGIEQVLNPMNDQFGFDQLALHDVMEHTDLMFNPIWYSSLNLLSDRGVRFFSTGMLGDVLLGGSYYWYSSQRKRFMNSLLLAVGLRPDFDTESTDQLINYLVRSVHQEGKKRLKYYKFLLKSEYQQICDEAMRDIEDTLRKLLYSYLENTDHIGGQQLIERFKCEHRDRQYVFAQELLIRAFGEVVLPTVDRDFLNLLTNISSLVKHDHYLYYRFFRQVYPDLGKVDVPNLYGSIRAPQLVIELRRTANKVLRKPSTQERTWVNFGNWMASPKERLDLYRQEFLKVENVFDPDAVNSYFDAIHRGERLLYDGNETLNFLSTALLVTQ